MKKAFKKWDFVVLAAVLFCSVIAFLCLNVFNNEAGSYVAVEVNGETQVTLPLDENTVYDIIIDGRVANTVEISSSQVTVSYADCPDKICRNQRAISKAGESIVCLPNKVIISVKGGSNEQIDGVAR